ncbi:MAG: flagellar FliJ family protein [Hydrogenophilaceae bacterium]|jgi:flagellar export protein FliJ|nr:flagellar FliJ family protein [Hydrogenophilaceae bacterium]
MARPFPLQLVLDLTRTKVEAKSRAVKLAHAEWLRARTQVVRIEQQRASYNDALSLRLKQGCASAVAGEASTVLCDYRKRLAAGRRAIDSAYATWQRTLGIWQSEKKRLEALQVLARRHAIDEARRDERQERRLHDELASKAAYLRMPMEKRETGFLLPGSERVE